MRGRREGPNEEIGAYHREGPPLSSLLCSLPWSRTMPGMQYATQYGKIIAGEKLCISKSIIKNELQDCKASRLTDVYKYARSTFYMGL